MDGNEMRAVLLQVVKERAGSPGLQSGTVLNEAANRLKIGQKLSDDQALLTFWHDLFRTGYLAWGYDTANPNPPFCHLTEQGRRALASMSRDPANRDGYLEHIRRKTHLSGIAHSYIVEALDTYNGGSYKASAVMVGAASERLVLDLRDALVLRLNEIGASVPQKLKDWRMKTVLDAIDGELSQRKRSIPNKLFEAFESYWPAFTQQIRSARNDAGHPANIEATDEPVVHGSLLIFPELAFLAASLTEWVATGLVSEEP